jgi:hypothetical protein
MSTILLSNALAVAGLVFASSLAAQTYFQPREQTQGPVTYVTGGVGEDEAQAMRSAAVDYPLTLELAAAAGGPRDEYISNAAVDIRDAQGAPVLRTRTDGPFLLVRLPSGSYNVDVEWNGAHKRKTIKVGTERREHVMIEFAGALDYR